jgi:TPR repeat protein
VNSEPSLVTAYVELCERHQNLMVTSDLELKSREWPQLKLRFESCVAALTTQSETNNPEIWYCLGDAFFFRPGVAQDRTASEHWLRRAAQAGHSKSMTRLGYMLRRDDMPERRSTAIFWFKGAAQLGYAPAMTSLGVEYREGLLVAADFNEALRWFQMAFEAGDLHAAVHVGRLLHRELRNYAEAVRWLRLAAEMGFVDSYCELAWIHGDRRSPVFDPAEAALWHRKLANETTASAPRALIALARASRDGQGVAQNREMARSYLEIVLRITDEKSIYRREAVNLLADIDASLF